MPRVPINIFALPFRDGPSGEFEYALFKRADIGEHGGIWQFISGGVEEGETIEVALKRECFEEASIPANADYYILDLIFHVPVFNFPVV